jgi:rhamnogalacturonan endolyase
MRIAARLLPIAFLLASFSGFAQRQAEALNRGVVALRTAPDSVFVSWRILGNDAANTRFNLYRKNAGGKLEKRNHKPLALSNFVDAGASKDGAYTYFVKTLVAGKESGLDSFQLNNHSEKQPYLSIPLQNIPGYTANDGSVGDLDGDGDYELVVHQTGRARDNSHAGLTDPPIFQAYTLEGKLLWTINLGSNIREGAHYTQFMVYDLDGDGRAELAMKTADGTIDGTGKPIGDSTKKYVNSQGRILDGPEYFTIFDGLTGRALATTDYIPSRYPIDGWGGNGGHGRTDNYGNRADRFLACIAYLDGRHPSVVMCRGYYGRTVLAAWDWQNGQLKNRWICDSQKGSNPFSGQGNHNLTAADVDGDGKDEIVYGSMVVDDDGKGKYSTGLRHGDALHVTDHDLGNLGLEVFGIHELENGGDGFGAALYNGKDGKILFQAAPGTDIGRGVAANIDPANPGSEVWWLGAGGLFNTKGEKVGAIPRSANFLVWWDGDKERELLDRTTIEKYGVGPIFNAEGCTWNNGTKSNPVLSADILGDWREEVIFRSADNKELRIYSTTIPTQFAQYTLMHDLQYRQGAAAQNVGYNQPQHTRFYMGSERPEVPKANIVVTQKPVQK